MTCDDARPALEALVDGELAREDERVLRDHLASCSACERHLADRRAFSLSLRSALEREFQSVEPPPGARERVTELLLAASRRRLGVPGRLAAALVIGLAVGLAAWAVGLSRPTRLQAEVADRLRNRDVHQEEIRELTREIGRDLEEALESSPSADPLAPPTLAIRQGAAVIESQIAEPAEKTLPQLVSDTASRNPAVRGAARSALKRLDPSRVDDLRRAIDESRGDTAFVQQIVEELEDRAQPVERGKVSISKTVNGSTVSLSQMRDGRVRLVIPGRTIEARGMADLLKRHAEVCRQYSVAGRDGFVTIDGTPAAVDFRGQLDLVFRTGTWTDEVQWDAYRAWMASRVPDPRQVEVRVKELQDRCRRQMDRPLETTGEIRVDVERIMKEVRAMTHQQLEETRIRVEQEMKTLDARLEELRDLRAHARGLRAYAEGMVHEK
jgi:anti-sigma factor RsiW